MPLYLDVHSIEGGVSALDVAAVHQKDVAEQGSTASTSLDSHRDVPTVAVHLAFTLWAP